MVAEKGRSIGPLPTAGKVNRAGPPRPSPVLRLAKVCRIFVANTADWAGFAGYTDL